MTGDEFEPGTGTDHDRAVDWPDRWSDRERVECYVGAVTGDVTVADIAEACGLSEGRVREILEELTAEDSALVQAGEDAWQWDEAALREQEREQFAEMDEEEVRQILERIEAEIAEWRDEFNAAEPGDVDDPEVEYDWRHNEHTRALILAVLGEWEYDVREQTGDESDPRALDVIARMVARAGQTRPPELVDEEISDVIDEHGEDAVRQCAWDILRGHGTFRTCGQNHFGETYPGILIGTSVTECLSRMQDS